MDTLNSNMKAVMGAFRKFHGKELDLINNSCKFDGKMNLCEPSKFEREICMQR